VFKRHHHPGGLNEKDGTAMTDTAIPDDGVDTTGSGVSDALEAAQGAEAAADPTQPAGEPAATAADPTAGTASSAPTDTAPSGLVPSLKAAIDAAGEDIEERARAKAEQIKAEIETGDLAKTFARIEVGIEDARTAANKVGEVVDSFTSSDFVKKLENIKIPAFLENLLTKS
jgi:hypothetical protein